METKFTKELHRRIGDGEYFWEILGRYGSNKTVAMLPKNCFVNKEEAEANAKLIAAAPELLEACMSAYRCSGEKNYLTKPVLDDLLNAIKKATE